MMLWLSAHWGDLILIAALALILGGIAFKLIRDRKNNKSSCGCGCESCAASSLCRSDAERKK